MGVRLSRKSQQVLAKIGRDTRLARAAAGVRGLGEVLSIFTQPGNAFTNLGTTIKIDKNELQKDMKILDGSIRATAARTIKEEFSGGTSSLSISEREFWYEFYESLVYDLHGYYQDNPFK